MVRYHLLYHGTTVPMVPYWWYINTTTGICIKNNKVSRYHGTVPVVPGNKHGARFLKCNSMCIMTSSS